MTKPTLRAAVGATATRLQNHYLEQAHTALGASARGSLADLRKYASIGLEHNPLALQDVLMLLQPELSDQELGKTDKPSPSEYAAFYALALFGVHMQSARTPAHKQGDSFALACGQLYRKTESNSIKQRFDAMQVALDFPSRITHLRSLVSLLRSQDLPFDYGQFAGDLRSLQNPKYRDGVLLRWGRDFAIGTLRPSAQAEAQELDNAIR